MRDLILNRFSCKFQESFCPASIDVPVFDGVHMLSGLAVSGPDKRIEAFDFTFSKGALRETEILDSTTSPPGRYVLEVARRIATAAPSAQLIAVANPLLPLGSRQLIDWLKTGLTGPAVISGHDNFPLCYVLPRRCVDELARFLTVLSTADADIDARLLAGILGEDVIQTKFPGLSIAPYPVSTSTGWFQGTERQKVLKILATHATHLVETNPAWRTLPFAVYHPYHAGSIVFFSVASRFVSTPLFQRHIVCSSYQDIVAAAGGTLVPEWLDQPWLPRDNSIGEPQYFAKALERLGPATTDNMFISFMRYSRISGFGPFHMVDQDRFSLGESITAPDQTWALQQRRTLKICQQPPAPLKVLFHINGGVPIKSYPDKQAKIVFQALRSFGVEISVIGRSDLASVGARPVTADKTDLLLQAVQDHHIFVGLDSFPHHFVRNVLGWPTIGLFGATTAANFGGGWDAHYRSLDAAMPCHPCNGDHQCPVFKRQECANYVPAEQVVAAVLAMASTVYGFRA
ncbi:MAG: hypothetical protein F8N37_23230 [Telmatospirillum sp.]|nr:hypothetical protein [Telmatospirillum sp.]